MCVILIIAGTCLKVTVILSSVDLGVEQSFPGSHASYVAISSLNWKAYYSLHSSQDNRVFFSSVLNFPCSVILPKTVSHCPSFGNPFRYVLQGSLWHSWAQHNSFTLLLFGFRSLYPIRKCKELSFVSATSIVHSLRVFSSKQCIVSRS